MYLYLVYISVCISERYFLYVFWKGIFETALVFLGGEKMVRITSKNVEQKAGLNSPDT